MIAHLVLFRPRPELSDADRQALADSFARALQEIPTVRRSVIGRRLSLGAAYEGLSCEDYPYAVVIEFEDLAGLKTYLEHIAHAEPAQRFYAAIEAALVFDYEMAEGPEAGASVRNWLRRQE